MRECCEHLDKAMRNVLERVAELEKAVFMAEHPTLEDRIKDLEEVVYWEDEEEEDFEEDISLVNYEDVADVVRRHVPDNGVLLNLLSELRVLFDF